MRKAILAALIMVALLMLAGPVMATVISFQDTATVWPGWGGYNVYGGSVSENTKDTIGTPDITGGTVSVENGVLNSVTFKYTGGGEAGWDLLKAGDLFIDLGADKTWDVVIHQGNSSFSVSPVSIPLLSTTGYLVTGSDNVDPWKGYDIRNNHPWAYSDSPDDFQSLQVMGPYVFSGLNVTVGDAPFIIGWTVNCANDVVYEKINPVPEPATMLLLGTGLVGLAEFGRKLKPKA